MSLVVFVLVPLSRLCSTTEQFCSLATNRLTQDVIKCTLMQVLRAKAFLRPASLSNTGSTGREKTRKANGVFLDNGHRGGFSSKGKAFLRHCSRIRCANQRLGLLTVASLNVWYVSEQLSA
jgi:hypothetical protein